MKTECERKRVSVSEFEEKLDGGVFVVICNEDFPAVSYMKREGGIIRAFTSPSPSEMAKKSFTERSEEMFITTHSFDAGSTLFEVDEDVIIMKFERAFVKTGYADDENLPVNMELSPEEEARLIRIVPVGK